MEEPEYSFDFRLRHGFAPVIFGEELDNQVKTLLSEVMPAGLSVKAVIDFYGGRFRSRFLNLLLRSAVSAPAQAEMLVTIYKFSRQAGLSGEVALWPDNDLGRIIGQDPPVFVAKTREYLMENDLRGLLLAEPTSGRIIFRSSLYT